MLFLVVHGGWKQLFKTVLLLKQISGVFLIGVGLIPYQASLQGPLMSEPYHCLNRKLSLTLKEEF